MSDIAAIFVCIVLIILMKTSFNSGFDSGEVSGAIKYAKGEIACEHIEFTDKWECKEVER